MKSRRNFLKQSMLGAGSMALTPGLFAANPKGKAPKRFIFIHKGNGLLPDTLVPSTLKGAELEKEKRKEAFE
ncbi:twin-arginine translocation signal domain-containing protein, partial [Akkermansiaceae bacterium]|nr:twin-arginine translocation signal domain-containing protein [Akkermansiaceae bacterium]